MAKREIGVNLVVNADVKQARAAMDQLQKDLSKLGSGGSISGTMNKELQQSTKLVAQLQVQLKNAFNQDTGKIDFAKFNQQMQASGVHLKDYGKALSSLGPQGAQTFLNLTRQVANSEIPFIRLNDRVKSLGVTLANTVKWQFSSSAIHMFIGGIQKAYGYAKDLNESLNNIRIVTGQSAEQMAAFAERANKAAQQLSSTTKAYTDASLIFYQQGLGDAEVEERTNAVIKMSQVTGEAAKEVSSYMTAIWNNFDDGTKSLEYYEDVITKLGAATAASSAEIAGGLQKFAAVAQTVGLSYEYAAAAVTTIVDKTRQSEDVVGTSLKTIFARLQGLSLGKTIKEDTGEKELVTDLTKYSKALQMVGVNIKDANNNLKSMDVILDELGERWNTLTKDQQVALAQTVGGMRQYNQFISLMDNWASVQENIDLAKNSEGTVQEQADIYAESWDAAEKRVQASAEAIYSDLLDDKFFIELTNKFADFLKIIDKIIDGMGGVKGVLGQIAPLIGYVFSDKIANTITAMPLAIGSMLPGGQARLAEKRESEITEALGGLSQNQQKEIKNLVSIEDSYIRNVDKMVGPQRQVYELLHSQVVEAENNAQAQREITKEMQTQATVSIRNTESALKLKNIADEEARIKASVAVRSYYNAQTVGASIANMGMEVTSDNAASNYASLQGNAASLQNILTGDYSAKYKEVLGQDLYNKQIIKVQELNASLKDLNVKDEAGIQKRIEEYNKLIEVIERAAQKAKEASENVIITAKGGYPNTESKMAEATQNVNSSDGQWLLDRYKGYFNIQNFSHNGNTAAVGKNGNEVRAMLNNFGSGLQEGATTAEVEAYAQKFAKDLKEAVTRACRKVKDGQIANEINNNIEAEMQKAASEIGARVNDEAEQIGNNVNKEVKEALNKNTKPAELGENIQRGADLGNTANAAREGFRNYPNEVQKSPEQILQGVTQGAMAISSAISTLNNLSKTYEQVQNGQMKLSEALIGNMTSLLFTIPMVIKGFAAMNAAINLGPTIAITALIAAIFVAIKAFEHFKEVQENDSLSKVAERSQKAFDELKERVEETKSEYNQLKQTVENYNGMLDSLNTLTRGTREWTEALIETNKAATELISNYGLMAGNDYTYENGVIKISEDALERVQRQALNVWLDSQYNASLAGVTNTRVQNSNQFVGRTEEIRQEIINAITDQFGPNTEYHTSRDYYSDEASSFREDHEVNQRVEEAFSELLNSNTVITSPEQMEEFLSNIDGLYYQEALGRERVAETLLQIHNDLDQAASATDNIQMFYGSVEDLINLASSEEGRNTLLNQYGFRQDEIDALIDQRIDFNQRLFEIYAEEYQNYVNEFNGALQEMITTVIADIENNQDITVPPEQLETAATELARQVLENVELESINFDEMDSERFDELKEEYLNLIEESLGIDLKSVDDIDTTGDRIRYTYYDENGAEAQGSISYEDMNMLLAGSASRDYVDTNLQNVLNLINNLEEKFEGASKLLLGGQNVNQLTSGQLSDYAGITRREYRRMLQDAGYEGEELNNALKQFEEFYLVIEKYTADGSDFQEIREELLETYNISANALDKLTVGQIESLDETLNKTKILYGDDALDFITDLYSMVGEEGASALTNALNNIDLSDWDAVDKLDDYLRASGIELTEEELQELAKRARECASAISYISFDEITSSFTEIASILKKIKEGAEISKKEYDSLDERYQQYFNLMADGSYRLMCDAEDFYELTNKGQTEDINARIERNNELANIAESGKYKDLELTSYENYEDRVSQLNALQALGYLDSDANIKLLAEDDDLYTDELNRLEQARAEIEAISEGNTKFFENGNEDLEIFLASANNSYDDLKENMEEYSDAAANVVIQNEALAEGFKLDELDRYQDYLLETIPALEGNETAANELALTLLKLEKGHKSLVNNWDTWSVVLRNTNHKTAEYRTTIMELTEALGDMFGMEASDFDENFITNADNLALIERAANNDTDALEVLGRQYASFQLQTAQTAYEVNSDEWNAYKSLIEYVTNYDYNDIVLGVNDEKLDSAIAKINLLTGANLDIYGLLGRDEFGRGVGLDQYTPKKKSSSGSKSKKDKKAMETDSERYYTITREIKDQEDALNRLSKAKDRAFGKAKLDLINEESKALERQVDLQKEYLREIEDYYKKDQAQLNTLGAKYDEQGVLSNYDEIMEREIAHYNELIAQGRSEEAEQRFKWVQDTIKQYDETNQLWQAEQDKLRDIQNQLYDKQLEKITTKLELEIQLDDLDLTVIDYQLKRLEDKAFSTAEKIEKRFAQMNVNLSKQGSTRDAVMSILANHGLTSIDSLAGLSNEQIANLGFTQAEIDKLIEYRGELINYQETIDELEKSILQGPIEAIKEWEDEFKRLDEVIEGNKKIISSYQNIASLLKGSSSEYDNALILGLQEQNVAYTSQQVSNARLAYDTNSARLAELKATIAAGGFDDEQREILEKELQETEKIVLESQQRLLSSYENAIKAARDLRKAEIEAAQEDVLNILSTTGNMDFEDTLFDLDEQLDKATLDSYESIYRFSKLRRQIGGAMEGEASLRNLERYQDILSEINALEESGAEVTEYQVEELQKKFELAQAYAALQDAQNAKDMVRMTRDADGNYGYIYSSGSSDDALQNYEDKLYEYQKYTSDFIKNQEKEYRQLEKQAIKAYSAIWNSNLPESEKRKQTEELKKRYSKLMKISTEELDRALEDNKWLYNDYWTWYSENFDYRISEESAYQTRFADTMLGKLRPTLESGEELYKKFIEATTGENGYLPQLEASSEKCAATIVAAGTSAKITIESFGAAMKTTATAVSSASSEMVTAAKAIESSFSGILDKLSKLAEMDFSSMRNGIVDAVEQIGELVEAYGKLSEAIKPFVQSTGTNDQGGGYNYSGLLGGSGGFDLGGGGDNGTMGSANTAHTQQTPTGPSDKQYEEFNRFLRDLWQNANSSIRSISSPALSKWNSLMSIFQNLSGLNSYSGASFKGDNVQVGINALKAFDPGKLLQLMNDVRTQYNTRATYSFDTGGYTGAWNSASGKLAVLHEKELVLNKEDTANMLQMLKVARDVIARVPSFGMPNGSFNSSIANGDFQQIVNINADFSGVRNSYEIEEAFNTLVNRAAQYANKKIY